jgi:hypothetical protein
MLRSIETATAMGEFLPDIAQLSARGSIVLISLGPFCCPSKLAKVMIMTIHFVDVNIRMLEQAASLHPRCQPASAE